MIASAPTKIILFGEHYVVYGAPALSLAVDQKRKIELIEIQRAKDQIEIKNPVYGESGVIFPDGTYDGHKYVAMHAAIYKEIYSRCPELEGKSFRAWFKGERIFKGMGASSALGACLALTLYSAAGKKVDLEEIFRCAQIGDEIDHGGRPSGIDARTVVFGGMIKFRREFNPDRFNFERTEVAFPKGTKMLIIDTYRGTRCNTGDLVKKFAESHGIHAKPAELDDMARSKVYAPYLPIYERALGLLREDANPEELGKLMNRNHELLSEHGVSTETIEGLRTLLLDNGALGFKITGAGGEGGACIALAYEKDTDALRKLILSRGFESIPLNPTNDFARLA
ncbi:MAG: hypothetical protein QXU54_03055 [Candidatus Micrarchaeia archaeon]